MFSTTATQMLLVWVLLIPAVSLCGAMEYYVRPTELTNGSCPGQPCLTLSQYISDTDLYFQSNTVFKFLPGTHHMEKPLVINNVQNMSLEALDTAEDNTDLPELAMYYSHNKSSGLPKGTIFQIMLNRSTNLAIKSLKINLHIRGDTYATAALALLGCERVVIDGCSVTYHIIESNPTIFYFNGSIVGESQEFSLLSTAKNGIVVLYSSEVIIHSSAIDSCDTAVMIDETFRATVNHTFISNCRFGVAVVKSFVAYIQNTTIAHSKEVGVFVLNSNQIGILKSNIFYSNISGITVVCSAYLIIDNTNVVGIADRYPELCRNDSEYVQVQATVVVYLSYSIAISNSSVRDSCGDGFSIANSSLVLIDSVHTYRTKYSGIYVDALYSDVHIVNATVLQAGNIGIDLRRVVHGFITNCTVSKVANNGILLLSSEYITLQNTKIYDIGVAGVSLHLVSASILSDISVSKAKYGCHSYIIGVISITSLQVTMAEHTAIFMHLNTTSLRAQDVSITNSGRAVFLYNVFALQANNITVVNASAKNTISLYNTAYGSFSNLTISESHWDYLTSTDSSYLPAALLLYNVTGVLIADCSFCDNRVTALKAVASTIFIDNTVEFMHNTAYRGAAMIFEQDSLMILYETAHVTFTNNHAILTGGAIHVTSNPYYRWIFGDATRTNCFFKSYTSEMALVFVNNSAEQGGDVLYGGSLDIACNDTEELTFYEHQFLVEGTLHTCTNSCLLEFKRLSEVISPSSLSLISSRPSRVCLCNDTTGHHDCLTVFDTTPHVVYPGETIHLSAVVVGQDFGTVAGSVYAQLLHQPKTSDDYQPHIESWQHTQGVTQRHCNQVSFTIFSHADEVVELVLTSYNQSLSVKPTMNTVESSIAQYREYLEDRQAFPTDLLEIPVYINITVLPCPMGFSLTADQLMCGCSDHLARLPKVTCSIQNQTVRREGSVWVGAYAQHKDGNVSSFEVYTSQYCPYMYCKEERLSLKLESPDVQCNYDHSGTLCGGCSQGLSLALGSAQCLYCSNVYLTLLIPFAVAGVLLVFLIKVLNLTVSTGYINGLIFFANIVKLNESELLPAEYTNVLTVFLSWLNMDLGIETCFFNGLDAYWKTWLQFVFPLYIWAIAGSLIFIARCNTKAAKLMGNNSVPVLSTLFLFSYAKLLRTIITSLSYTVLNSSSVRGHKVVWSADGNIDYLGAQHAPLFTAAVASLLFLWLPYTLTLLTGQWLHKCNSHVINRILTKLKPFLDAHYGPLKDKHCYWFGALLLAQVIPLLVSVILPNTIAAVNVFTFALMAVAILGYSYATSGLYQNRLASLSEALFLINLVVLGLSNLLIQNVGGTLAIIANLSLAGGFVQFCALVIIQVYSSCKHTLVCIGLRRMLSRRNKGEGDDEFEIFEHRQPLDREDGSEDEGALESLSLNTYGI